MDKREEMRPSDIPQWAWDQADKALIGWTGTSVHVVCARLLSQARSQAYDECIEIAEMHEGAYEMNGIISVAIREAASNPHSEKVE